jgi:hypothetical protein
MLTFDLQLFSLYTRIFPSLLSCPSLACSYYEKTEEEQLVPPEQSEDCYFHFVPEDSVVIDVFKP